MQLVILANDQQKEEILSGEINHDCKIEWINSREKFSSFPNADAFFDLLFEDNGYDILHLKKFLSKTVFVQSIHKTIEEIGNDVIRMNAWPGFLKRPVVEAACNNDDKKMMQKEF